MISLERIVMGNGNWARYSGTEASISKLKELDDRGVKRPISLDVDTI